MTYVSLYNDRVKKSDKETAKDYIMCLKDYLKKVQKETVIVKLQALPLAPRMDFSMLENEDERFSDELNYLMRKSRTEGLTLDEKQKVWTLFHSVPGVKKEKPRYWHKRKKREE